MSNIVEIVIRATDQASGQIEKFGGALAKMGGTVAGMAAAMGAAGAATVAFTSKMVAGIESVSDAATRLGTSATKLSELGHAAALANVPADALNNSLQIMQRTAADAAENGGKVARSLADMGISAQAFSSMPVDAKLALVADKFTGMADAGQRARLANELFGRSGAQMLQMLDGGSAGLAKAAEEARKFGVVIGPQQAANAKAFGDMMDRMGAAGTGLGRAISDQLVPMITGLGNRLANFIAEHRGTIAAWVQNAVRHFVAFGVMTFQVFGRVRSYIAGIFEPGGVSRALGDFVQVAYGAFRQLLVGAIVIGKGIISVTWEWVKAAGVAIAQGFRVAFLLVADMAAQLGSRLIDLIRGNVPEQSLTQMFADALGRAGAELSDSMIGSLDGVDEAARGFFTDLGTFASDTATQAGDAFSGAFDLDLGAALETADAMIAKVSEFGQVVEDTVPPATEVALGFWDHMSAAGEAFLTSHKTAVEEIAASTFDLVMSSAARIGDVFAQAIVFGKSLGDSLRQLGKQVLADMLSMLIRIGIQRLILSKIVKGMTMSEAFTGMTAGVGQVFINSFASAAAIPVIGWEIAPGIAKANAAIAGGVAQAALGAAGGAAAMHGGMGYVPEESTYFLQRGERVLSPRQNTDFTDFLEGNSQSSQSPINVNFNEEMITDGRGIRKLLRSLDYELRAMGHGGLMANGRSLL